MTIPKPGDELKLRNGWPAKVLAVHPEQKWAIFIEYKKTNADWTTTTRLLDGRTFHDMESNTDLILPEPEPKRLRGWVNVYRRGQRAWFDSKEMADSPSCAAFRTECLYIDIPYEEGEGL